MGVTITIKKLTTALSEKTRTHKKGLEHEVSIAAVAASQQQSLLADMTLERRKVSELQALPRRVRKSEKASGPAGREQPAQLPTSGADCHF